MAINKKILGINLEVLLILEILIGILVPISNKNNDQKENENVKLVYKFINAKTEENGINILQTLYKLKNKKQTEINTLASGIPKTRYISARELAKKLFAIKSSHKISLLKNKKNSNLKEILLLAISKNIKKIKNSSLTWPLNHIDQTNDKLAILSTFF